MDFQGFPIEVTVRANARHLRLRVKPGENRFHLTLPPRTTQAEVNAFLQRSRDWMAQQTAQMSAWQPSFAPGERHLVLGQRVTLGENGVPSGNAFLQWRQRQLEALVAKLLPLWMEKSGLRPKVVRYRVMRSRWGSCVTGKAAITLSTELALVPPAYVEAVLVHELCHLRYADHSAQFHALLDSLLPDSRQRERALQKFDRRPLAP